MSLIAATLVPILFMTNDGVVYKDVELPSTVPWLVCVREYEAPAIRCYAVDPKTKEVRYADYELSPESR